MSLLEDLVGGSLPCRRIQSDLAGQEYEPARLGGEGIGTERLGRGRDLRDCLGQGILLWVTGPEGAPK